MLIVIVILHFYPFKLDINSSLCVSLLLLSVVVQLLLLLWVFCFHVCLDILICCCWQLSLHLSAKLSQYIISIYIHLSSRCSSSLVRIAQIFNFVFDPSVRCRNVQISPAQWMFTSSIHYCPGCCVVCNICQLSAVVFGWLFFCYSLLLLFCVLCVWISFHKFSSMRYWICIRRSTLQFSHGTVTAPVWNDRHHLRRRSAYVLCGNVKNKQKEKPVKSKFKSKRKLILDVEHTKKLHPKKKQQKNCTKREKTKRLLEL